MLCAFWLGSQVPFYPACGCAGLCLFTRLTLEKQTIFKFYCVNASKGHDQQLAGKILKKRRDEMARRMRLQI